MKRPLDPRKHGLKPPGRTIEHCINTSLKNVGTYYAVRWDVQPIIKEFVGIQEFVTNLNAKITIQPHINDKGVFSYSYEEVNRFFDHEQMIYDKTMAEYNQACLDFAEYESKKEAARKDKESRDVDEEIERMEHRLANLKARKAGEPLPFPKG